MNVRVRCIFWVTALMSLVFFSSANAEGGESLRLFHEKIILDADSWYGKTFFWTLLSYCAQN